MAKKTVTIAPGRTITGNELEIVRELRMQAFDLDDTITDDEYITKVARDIFRTCGKGIDVQGNTPQEKAESFMRELARIGIITIEEE